uniref:Derlin n=1 Tax=Nitzschia sp. IriIs04 TaxID=1444690 RepID=A0A0P0YV70_9STRA|nr:symbiotic PPC-localized Der [Nitzschia sp. IriIs04]
MNPCGSRHYYLSLAVCLVLCVVAQLRVVQGLSPPNAHWTQPAHVVGIVGRWNLQQQRQQRQQQRDVSSLTSVFAARGGARSSEEEDETEGSEEEEVLFDLDEDDEDMGVLEMDLDDDTAFREADPMDRFLQAYHKTPPLTKAYITASALATAYGFLFNNNVFPSWLLLDWRKIVTRGQFWRIFTTFVNFGPFGIGYALTCRFIWTYMSTLERLHHHRPYDFWIMIGFGMISMVVGYSFLGLNAQLLGHNLSTYLVYVWSRHHEGMDVDMFELFTARAELLPWFFVAQTYLLEGAPPIMDILGIVFGHVYFHCKSTGLLRAPDALVDWYVTSESAKPIRQQYKQISSDFELNNGNHCDSNLEIGINPAWKKQNQSFDWKRQPNGICRVIPDGSTCKCKNEA